MRAQLRQRIGKAKGAYIFCLLVLLVLLLLCQAPWAIAQTTIGPGDNRAAEDLPTEAKSLTEVNKELSNPISSIWALAFQQNTYWLNKPERNNVNLQFQPVLPVSLTENWNLITRPVLQLMNSAPYLNRSGNPHRVTGFGDAGLVSMLSPTDRLAGNWLLGAGPTFIFPTASNTRLGQNKWQLGPAGVFGYLGERYIVGVFPQQWWSVGGAGSNTVSQFNAQYFASYFLPNGWSVGTSPNILVNWYARKASNVLTFPIGVSISKVQKIGFLPVRFGIQGQYMPVHPDAFGQKWNLQVILSPVIPKLIKGSVLEDW
jgi:hypothetical protein